MATKRKRKNTGGKPLIITFVCLVAVTLAVFGVFFGADKYERSTHPMLYSDLVDRYSSQYKLDKYAVYSFICVESGFNENSESYLGARGLMQIMPETFEWIRYKLDEENDPDMTFDNMYNAEDNIRYG
ncbi:MAG: transglycosylase SLT domain-containing protein, partial [Ruminiclostridium sp.]|nr:transglycosylase SLT domain-containing protein [Ruminiclostridium sp.]